MTYPAITAFYAAILGLIYVGLSGWVVFGRVSKETLIGDGGDSDMTRRIRSHANFQEYVPFALLLIGLLEASGGGQTAVRVMLIILVVARLMHPIGMFAKPNSPPQFIFRGAAVIATLAILVVSAIMLLSRIG